MISVTGSSDHVSVSQDSDTSFTITLLPGGGATCTLDIDEGVVATFDISAEEIQRFYRFLGDLRVIPSISLGGRADS